MKKLSLAVAVAAAITAGSVQAYTVATPAVGVLVPLVFHNGSGDTTVVGVINHGSPANGADAATVTWGFYDVNSAHLADGQFQMTGKDWAGFNWAAIRPGLTEQATGTVGYLVMTSTGGNVATNVAGLVNDDPAIAGHIGNPADRVARISANSFHVNVAAGDATYIPVFPLNSADYNGNHRTNPAAVVIGGVGAIGDTLLSNTVVSPFGPIGMASGAAAGDAMLLNYSFNNGDSSNIVYWTPHSVTNVAGNPTPLTVHSYNTQQARASWTLALPNRELNLIDPNSAANPYNNGFTELTTVPQFLRAVDGSVIAPAAATAGTVSFTVVNAPAFRATQTMLNPHGVWQVGVGGAGGPVAIDNDALSI